MTTVTFDELANRVGESLGSSEWHKIDQQSIDTFARVTLDEQWIHVDIDRAAASPFGGTIAHGFLTLALCTRLMNECFTVSGVSTAINYGLNRVRFPSPVRAGTRIRGSARLVTYRGTREGVDAVVEMTIRSEGSEKPACVAELVVRLIR